MKLNKTLEEIPKGEHGWVNRELEIFIIKAMTKATTPQSCYCIKRKIRKKTSASFDEISIRMKSLSERGHLSIVDNHPDLGYLYQIN